MAHLSANCGLPRKASLTGFPHALLYSTKPYTVRVASAKAMLGLFCLSLPAFAFSKTDLIIWGMGLGPDSRGLEAVVRQFETENPEYHVRMLNLGAGHMNPQKLMTAIVGNAAPDLIHQGRFNIADWASRDAFRPLDDLVARDVADPDSPKRWQYYDAAWQEAMYGGKIYAIPTQADNRCLYYNKDVFRAEAPRLRAAGLDPERPPRTWSELLAYSKVFTKKDARGNLMRAGFMPNFGNSWLYLYAFQMNASFLSPDGRTCIMDNPRVVTALEFMVEGYDLLGGYENAQKFAASFQGGENDPFISGSVVMKIDGDWGVYGLARYGPSLDFGVAPPPSPDDRVARRGIFRDETEPFVTWSGGFGYAIPRGAKHVEGAWKFTKFATSLRGRLLEMREQKIMEERRGRLFVPRILAQKEANVAMLGEEFLPGKSLYAEALRTHVQMAEHTRFRPTTFAGQLLWDEHVRAFELACMHNATPKEALTSARERVQRILDEEFGKTQFPIVDLRVASWVGIGGALLGLVLILGGLTRAPLGKLARHEAYWGYFFLAPWLIGFLVFTLGPMVVSLFFSFTQYNVLTECRWVGLNNFHDLFRADGDRTAKSFYNALYLGGIGVPLGLVTGLSVALLLNTGVRGMRIYRTVYYLPAIVPGVAAAVLWSWVLNADPGRGIVNSFWQNTISSWFGAPPPGWLGVEAWAKPSLIMMGLWGAGSGMILWLAGLKGVPQTLYESAALDGAGAWKQFWSITLPQLSPIVFFSTVMGLIGTLQTFDSVYILTGGTTGGPNDALLVPVYQLFLNGFTYFRMGYASALAWIIFLVIVLLTALQFGVARKWVHYEVSGR